MSGRSFPWAPLLFISAAINLLIIGAAIGGYAAGVRLERQAIDARLPAPRTIMAALPQDTRAKVREEVARTWAETRIVRQTAAQARREAFDAAATEPFDVARVRTAFARVRASDEATLAAFHNNIIDAFARMTPAERQRAIAALRGAAPVRRAAQAAPASQSAVDDPNQREELTPRQRFREAVRERLRERRERRLGAEP